MIDKRYIDKPGDLSILNPMYVTVDVGKSAHKINKVLKAFEKGRDTLLYMQDGTESILRPFIGI